ncbi:MAG: molybdopterin molybdotransferase MoeA [Puia sp.]|nr:molybdopterin molybdotransferase MoeA [Puia sp.]
MISVQEAREIIRDNVSALSPVKIPLAAAAGLVLAEDLYAGIDIPAFPQSSMDGYALSYESWKSGGRLAVSGRVPAGHKKDTVLLPEQTVRIFTGAPVPTGADTVVMQEKVRVENGCLVIEDDRLVAGANVRPAGAEIRAGALALAKDSRLTPAAMGFLTGIGIAHARVYPNPSITIIVTGDELQEIGQPLQYGQVYEANSHALTAALAQWRIGSVRVIKAADSLDRLTEILGHALTDSDLVFLTGGISVGDFDFVWQASRNCGVQQLFHKVRQRPAKPLYFGKKDDRYVFGLPGNPASGLTSFYEYIVPALCAMTRRMDQLTVRRVPLQTPLKKPAGLTHFLKGFYDGYTATILEGQESFRMGSFAKANCLVQIDEGVTHCAAGEEVEIHLLPVS